MPDAPRFTPTPGHADADIATADLGTFARIFAPELYGLAQRVRGSIAASGPLVAFIVHASHGVYAAVAPPAGPGLELVPGELAAFVMDRDSAVRFLTSGERPRIAAALAAADGALGFRVVAMFGGADFLLEPEAVPEAPPAPETTGETT